MPTIELTQGQRTRVDWCDYRELSIHKWFACRRNENSAFYAHRSVGGTTVLMHRQILGLTDSKEYVDHKNRDGLDNRRRNLHSGPSRLNQENRRDQSSWGPGIRKRSHLKAKPFEASARLDGVRHYLGYFAAAREAKTARVKFLKENL